MSHDTNPHLHPPRPEKHAASFCLPHSNLEMRPFNRRRSKRTYLLSALAIVAYCIYTFYYLPQVEARLAEAAARAKMQLEEFHRQQLLQEDADLDYSASNKPRGKLAAHQAPEFADILLLKTLDPKLVPSAPRNPDGRLLIIGDVHGMKTALDALLTKARFDAATDHLIFAGDLVSKGPDSAGVVKLAMSLRASAVRGNHEDRLLLAWAGMHRQNAQMEPVSAGLSAEERDKRLAEMESFARSAEYKFRVLAREFTEREIRWLAELPVILKVGSLGALGEVVVVHGGLVPGLDLERQDPYGVMNMRTIDLKTHVPSNRREGVPWFKLWNRYQEKQEPEKRSTVIYGHNSRVGLNINSYSRGIDTACVRGGQLTAVVIESAAGGFNESLVQVDCEDGRA